MVVLFVINETAKQVESIKLTKERRKERDQPVTPSEKKKLRGVIGAVDRDKGPVASVDPPCLRWDDGSGRLAFSPAHDCEGMTGHSDEHWHMKASTVPSSRFSWIELQYRLYH